MEELVQNMGKLAEKTKSLVKQAVKLYSVEVEVIINDQSHNAKRIERCLDGMLAFCFYDGMLAVYKKLCRYYYNINPEATVYYVNSYRETRDKQESKDLEIK